MTLFKLLSLERERSSTNLSLKKRRRSFSAVSFCYAFFLFLKNYFFLSVDSGTHAQVEFATHLVRYFWLAAHYFCCCDLRTTARIAPRAIKSRRRATHSVQAEKFTLVPIPAAAAASQECLSAKITYKHAKGPFFLPSLLLVLD